MLVSVVIFGLHSFEVLLHRKVYQAYVCTYSFISFLDHENRTASDPYM